MQLECAKGAELPETLVGTRFDRDQGTVKNSTCARVPAGCSSSARCFPSRTTLFAHGTDDSVGPGAGFPLPEHSTIPNSARRVHWSRFSTDFDPFRSVRETALGQEEERAWAAWNYLRRHNDSDRVSVTYNMNILQGVQSPQTFCVTLNDSGRIDPGRIICRLQYDHPLYTAAGVAAQQRQQQINGRHRTWYCGAYWRYGFHEDGVVSALNALQDFRDNFGYAQSPLRRAG